MNPCNIHQQESCEICAFYNGPTVPLLMAFWAVPAIGMLIFQLFQG